MVPLAIMNMFGSAIDAALSSAGFIYLSNHGIDQRKVDTDFDWISSCSYNMHSFCVKRPKTVGTS